MFLQGGSWSKFTNCQNYTITSKRRVSLDALLHLVFIDSWNLITFQLLFLWDDFKTHWIKLYYTKTLIFFSLKWHSKPNFYVLEKYKYFLVSSSLNGFFLNVPLKIRSGNLFWNSESIEVSLLWNCCFSLKLSIPSEKVSIWLRLTSNIEPLLFCRNTLIFESADSVCSISNQAKNF